MILPLFPLEIAVFPGEVVPLHIFEARYKQLIVECRDEGITFGILPIIEEEAATFGTELKLERILTTYESGEMDILTTGLRVFRLDDFRSELPGKLYAGGEVTFVENEPGSDEALRRDVIALYHELQELVSSGKRMDDPEDEDLSFLLAQNVGLALPLKVEVLSMASEAARLTFIGEHLAKILPGLKAAHEKHKMIGGNGHLKDFKASD